MWTQRDQLQAYQFLRRRLVSALQVGDANHPTSPSRRLIVSGAVGIGVALLISAGFLVVGVLRPGSNQDWRQPGQVIIERETGASYILGADGLLHPVLNYASARLLAGGDGVATATVSGRSLEGIARGATLGIPGAPTSLPTPERLLTGPWTVCSDLPQGRPVEQPARTTGVVGVPADGRPVAADEALIVRDRNGARYAVTGGRRLRIRNTETALGYDQVGAAVPVSPAWLDAVPLGPELSPITITGHGDPGPRIGREQTRVGQIIVVEGVGSGNRYYVVQDNGLDPVTQTEAALILGNRDNAYQGQPLRPITVSTADVAGQKIADRPPRDYPERVPKPIVVTAEQVVCAVSASADQVSVVVTAAVPLPGGGKPVPDKDVANDPRLADELVVPPARGALVRDQISPTADSGTIYILTDQGVRYPIGGPDALKALGYGAVKPVPVASTLLGLFPLGPSLDIASAQREVA